MKKHYSNICEFDENGDRCLHLWTGEDYSIMEENLDADNLPLPGTVIVLINGTDSRSVVLKAFSEINTYLEDVFSEDFRKWADFMDFKEEEERAKLERFERADNILTDLSQYLSNEDLRFVEQAVRSHVD